MRTCSSVSAQLSSSSSSSSLLSSSSDCATPSRPCTYSHRSDYWPSPGVQSIAMSVSVCLSVCLSVRPSARTPERPHIQTILNFLYVYCCGPRLGPLHADNAICYACILPVLWMTTCLSITGPVACGVGNIYVHECRAGAISHKFPTYSPWCATLFDHMTTCEALPLVAVHRARGIQLSNVDCQH